MNRYSQGPLTDEIVDRRRFIEAALGSFVLVGTSAIAQQAPPKPPNGKEEEQSGEEEEEMVSPAEDLMREHGLLNRILLIYDESIERLSKPKPDIPLDVLSQSAKIVRTFVEDYHEKLEENYLFPRFRKAGKQLELVGVLLAQHQAGRNLTDQVILLAKQNNVSDESARKELISALHDFNKMYRPHEAREDTVLFPAFKEIVSEHEYAALGEDFEKKEHQLFGGDGFEEMVDKVAGLEKRLGIYDLAKFTPEV